MRRFHLWVMTVVFTLQILTLTGVSAQVDALDQTLEKSLSSLLELSDSDFAPKADCWGLCVDLSNPNCTGGAYSCCLEEAIEEPDCAGVIFWIYCNNDCESQEEEEQPTPDGSVDTFVEPEVLRAMMTVADDTSLGGLGTFRKRCSGAITARWYSAAVADGLRAGSRTILF